MQLKCLLRINLDVISIPCSLKKEAAIKSKHIGLDKSGYQVNIFLISPRKYMLWVLIRSASVRHF